MHRSQTQHNSPRIGRARRTGRAAAALAAAALIIGVAAPGAAARSTLDVEDCSDTETICGDITVTDPAEPEEPEESKSGLSICSSVRIEGDRAVYDVCAADGTYVMTLEVDISTRPKPNRQSVVSSAMGALNPPKPTIRTSPRVGSGLLVQTPTWLWIPPSYWRTYTTTVTVMGYVVTIYATPTTVRWKMGNGGSITCVGPGTPWIPGLSDILSTCKYTYRHSSDGQPNDRYKITATVTFVGSFSTTALGGMRGPLGAVTRSSSVRARVAEIQGLVVS